MLEQDAVIPVILFTAVFGLIRTTAEILRDGRKSQ